MCGIAGLFDRRRNINPETLASIVERMTDSLALRGPDGRGIWVDPERGFALGNRRLAIVDLTPTGAQPMMLGAMPPHQLIC